MAEEISWLRVDTILNYNKCKPHSVEEMSKNLDIPRVSVHRLIRMMLRLGWVRKEGRIWNKEQTRTAFAYQSVKVITNAWR